MPASELPIDVSLVSAGFVAGLALIAVARKLAPRTLQIGVAAVLSAALIGLGSWMTLVVIGGVALGIVHPLSRLIARWREAHPGRGRAVLALGIAAVLAVWLMFKLNREVELPWLRSTGWGAELLQLVGFSYFIFRGINVLYMHYLVGVVPGTNALHTLYFSIFPATITSGPIQKYPDFCKELSSPAPLELEAVGESVERITRGYFYKVCIAPVFQAGADGLLGLERFNAYQSFALAGLMYLFVFFDFSGYSHIAIGFGRLMGIRVPENFRQPFLATSITEFWRNWHISIGDWFRDHVFIPLGGMRLGGWRAAVFAATIMLLCGAWHGFTLMFLGWGVWHASLLFFDGMTGAKPMPPAERHGWRWWLRILWTNARIALGALFFLPSFTVAAPVMEGFLRWW